MSIAAIIDTFGRTLYIMSPTTTVGTDGAVVRTYPTTPTATAKGFIQPSGQTEDVFEGRQNARTATTIYFAGVVAIGIDDLIYDVLPAAVPASNSRVWRVTGRIVPGDVGTSSHLCMTVCDCIEVEPDIDVTVPP